MPRSRGSEVPQRPSPRGQPHLKTSSSDSDPTHHRPITDRSPKIGERRSPRGSQSDPVGQKKLGTRIADLESQLGQAQDELKNLKEQLSSAEAAKKEAQEKLEKKARKPAVSKGKNPQKGPREPNGRRTNPSNDDHPPHPHHLEEETDVFEVPIEKATIVPDNIRKDDEMNEARAETPETEMTEMEKPGPPKEDEVGALRAKLEEKEKEAELLGAENESLRAKLSEAESRISSVEAKEEEAALKLREVQVELEVSRAKAAELREQGKSLEEAKETLEAEMKRMRVQTEQWRKAADAAAAVLSGGGVDTTGRIPDRCGSMNKNYIGSGYGFMGSPADDADDAFGGGKRKGSGGMKMFGDLWKKKGQK